MSAWLFLWIPLFVGTRRCHKSLKCHCPFLFAAVLFFGSARFSFSTKLVFPCLAFVCFTFHQRLSATPCVMVFFALASVRREEGSRELKHNS